MLVTDSRSLSQTMLVTDSRSLHCVIPRALLYKCCTTHTATRHWQLRVMLANNAYSMLTV